MKVLHLASGDLWAGAEVQVFHLLTKMIKSQDVEVMAVLLNHGRLENELKIYGVEVVVLDESLQSVLSILKKLYCIAKEFKVNIIHTHRYKENIFGGLVARLLGLKSVRTAHGMTELAELSGNKFSLMPLVTNSLDKFAACVLQQKIVAVSNELKDKLSRIYSPRKLEVIENGINIEYVLNRSKEVCDISVEPDYFNVAFVGRFVPAKGIDLFYEIAKAALLADSKRQIRFHMIGDGPLMMQVENRLNIDKLDSKIILHGFVENVAPLLRKMNLLMFTSSHEGLPMTLLEAMALGVPVLSRNLPSIKDVLCDGGCGFVLNTDRIDDYVHVIFSLLENDNDTQCKVKMARTEVQAKYSIESIVEKYLELYHNLLIQK